MPKSGLRLQCDIAGNASKVTISSYTMPGWQHGSKHAEVWRQCPLFPWEQNQNKWPPFFASTLLFVTEIRKNALSLRITVLVELRLLFANMFNWKKDRTSATPCQNVQVWNLYGIWKIRSIPYIKSSIPYFSHSVFHTDFSFHSTVCPGYLTKIYKMR